MYNVYVYTVYNVHHRSAIYFVFTIELNLLLTCFVLSALYVLAQCAYTETVDPARRPSIPQVRQGSVRFNLKEEEPPPFPFLLYTYSMLPINEIVQHMTYRWCCSRCYPPIIKNSAVAPFLVLG